MFSMLLMKRGDRWIEICNDKPAITVKCLKLGKIYKLADEGYCYGKPLTKEEAVKKLYYIYCKQINKAMILQTRANL